MARRGRRRKVLRGFVNTRLASAARAVFSRADNHKYDVKRAIHDDPYMPFLQDTLPRSRCVDRADRAAGAVRRVPA
jgi:hypothetical protein